MGNLTTRSESVRTILGVACFAWAALFLGIRIKNVAPNPDWPLYLLAGAVLGAVLTRATRNAGRRLRRVLAALGTLALVGIVAMVVLNRGGDMYIEFLPVESFVALTLLPLPLWLFLSSRATAETHGSD